MPLQIPEGFAIAAFVHTGSPGTQPYVTTLGLDISPFGQAYVTAADALFEAWAAHVMPEVTNLLTLDKVTLFVGGIGPSGSVDSSLSTAGGLATGNFAPTAMSPVVRKVTTRLGRKGRGRMFLPGILLDTEVDADGSITVTGKSKVDQCMEDFAEKLANPTPGGPYEGLPLIGYLFHNDATPPDPILNLTCSDTVGWIRGRIR